MSVAVAYTSGGKLYLKEGGKPVREVVSRFAEEARSRALKRSERQGWKRGGSSGGLFSGQMLWGGRDDAQGPLVSSRITGVTRTARPGTLFYLLETDAVGGLFLHETVSGAEKRLFHKEGLRARDPDFHPETFMLAFSLVLPNGSAGIALADPEGQDIDRLTEGDSVDEAPSWLPDAPKALVYHSGGVARAVSGIPVGLGPCSIHRLDLHRRQSEVLLENKRYDYLQPHGTADGSLLFIRRPYESPEGRRATLGGTIKDIVLFPFRVIRSGFDFLNAFAMAFSQKPLTTAGGPKLKGPEIHTLFIRGRAIDARKAMEKFSGEGEPPSLVPGDWELVRRGKDGSEAVLAGHAASFDASPDGTIVYTNGSSLFRIPAGGKAERLDQGRLVEQVVILEAAPQG